MSDNEYERFEITDSDLANEFNPNRPRRRLTKNQTIYGIWADDSDNDSADETSRRGRRRGLGGGGISGVGGSNGSSKSKDYTAPVSFVAGGIQQSGKKSKEKSEKLIEDDHPITDEEDERPAFGRAQIADDNDVGAAASTDEYDSSADEMHLPKIVNQRSGVGAGIGVGVSATINNKNVGAWEQHTRGIGAKLLLQMGYKPGMGLGKDLQGISQPVEAHVRKGRGAIGAYGPEKKASVPGKSNKNAIDVGNDDDLNEVKDFKDKTNKWKRGDNRSVGAGGDKTKRYYYKSVEEVIEKGKNTHIMLPEQISKKLGNVPVIDMTGPEKRILSGYHAIAQTRVVDEDLYIVDGTSNVTAANKTKTISFALPELMHNLNLIVNMCEQDIIALDKSERESLDKQATLVHERKNLEEIVKLEENHMETLEAALKLVEELTDSGERLTLERAEKIFLELQQQYAAEYKEFGLADLTAGIIAPLVKNALEMWRPLEQPTKNIDLVKKWRTILETNAERIETSEQHNIFEPYSSLIWAGVIPSFRACAANWNPKQHQPMVALLDCWAPLFPTWILDSILEQLVLPRLSNGVREWDPLTDTVPIHLWILPWNAILGHKMEEYIFPTIREKLGNALLAWMPQDRSARAMLTPWKGAFNDAEMQMFLMQHIIPKLQMVLSELIINPLQQNLELWNQVWEWHEIIPPILMVQLLDKYFFPKWMQVLVLWLNQSPDYAEISRWYTGWKSMFSEEILRDTNIQEHLRRALEMMHRATETIVTTAATLPASMLGAKQQQHQNTMRGGNTPPPPPPPFIELQQQQQQQQQINVPAQLEFKELVSQKCAERGILFAPIPGRRELGKQVYRVGRLYCYIDRNVCMLSDSSFKNWMPTSVIQMLEHAVTGLI